jgi:hypothetical protein
MSFDSEPNGTQNVGPIPPLPSERRKWFLGVPVIIGLIFVSAVYLLEGENAMVLPQEVAFKNEAITFKKESTRDLLSKPEPNSYPKPESPNSKMESKLESILETTLKAKVESKPESKSDPTKKIGGDSPKGKATSEAHPVDIEKLLDFEQMLEVFEVKRQELYTKLEKDYGPETFTKMFLNRRGAIDSHSQSRSKKSMGRMRRKMMLKIIQGQAAATNNQRSRNLRAEDWTNITSQENRRMKDADLAVFPTYVWATGGHRYVVSARTG